MPSFDDVLAHVLTKKPFVAVGAPRELLAHMRQAALEVAQPIDEVIWHASSLDRLGLAFTAGYSAATRVLTTRLGVSLPGHVSLAATEAGGAHPRAIDTRPDSNGLASRIGHAPITTWRRATVVICRCSRSPAKRGALDSSVRDLRRFEEQTVSAVATLRADESRLLLA